MGQSGRIIGAAAGLLVVGLTGCATPQYQTVYRYEPPAGVEGQVCLQSCEQQKQACQADCKVRYQACQKEIEPLVEERYLQALKHYESELRDYTRRLREYELQQWMYWPNDFWPHYHHHPYAYYWPAPYFPPPYLSAVMPTREGVKARLEKERCQADCGCLPTYDACYENCGGKRIPEQVCVAHCKAPAPVTNKQP